MPKNIDKIIMEEYHFRSNLVSFLCPLQIAAKGVFC